MTNEKALQLESQYLAGMESNFDRAKGKLLRGSHWQLARRDESDRLRSLMAQHKKFDRQLLSAVPKNRRIELHSYQRKWLLWKKRVGVAVASVVSPMEWHVQEGGASSDGPPIGARELLEHLRSLQLTPGIPHIVGICSPTGFTPEARQVQLESNSLTLVLIEPSVQGGWQIANRSEKLDPRIMQMFDPEDDGGKIARVQNFLQAHSAELLTGGLATEDVARRLGLPENIVARAFEQISKQDSELQIGTMDGQKLIYRGVASEKQESFSMSMVDRIRQLFSRSGDEAQKINELSKRRAALSQRRNRMYDDIAQLEQREADLLAQGKQNNSQVVRRRIAAQIAQLRKDLMRHNATTNMLNKQINILSTDIHNLTLIQQGQLAELPSTEELTENAVKAEEMLETLNADAELVGSLEAGMSETLASADELEILKEFETPEKSSSHLAAANKPMQRQSDGHTGMLDMTRDDEARSHGQKQEPEAS